jgi:NAD(P)-dependent dehydrogenase (short-subunit alcohol dehydrogenase family)
MSLNNRVMLVTGGAHRVGKAIAVALASEGARVGFTYNSSEESAKKTRDELDRLTPGAWMMRCDQSDPGQIEATMQAALANYGRLDGLVNSASIMQEKTFFEIGVEDWDLTLNINARGPFFFTQLAGKWMLEHGGGAIVNIIDESAVGPTSGYIHHGASKSALWMLTRSSALILAPSIRVNAVLPGAVLKPPNWEEERWQSLKRNIPLKKLGTAEDVARAVVYLMEEEFITGQMIVVDGGSTLRG